VNALHDDSSFYVIYQRVHTMNFMLKPSRLFQMIIPAVGNSILLKIPLKTFTHNLYTAKLSCFTVKLHVSQVDDLRQTIEQFFEFRRVSAAQLEHVYG
jgi:hypothetical protein